MIQVCSSVPNSWRVGGAVSGTLGLIIVAVALAAIFVPAAFPAAIAASAVWVALGGAGVLFVTISLLVARALFQAQRPLPMAPPPQEAKNTINWGGIVDGSRREPYMAPRVKMMLEASTISSCPYKKIFVSGCYLTGPVLTFEEDGNFYRCLKNLSCNESEILFIHVPTSKGRSDQFAITPHFCTSDTHPKIKVSYIPYAEWISGILSPATVRTFGFSS